MSSLITDNSPVYSKSTKDVRLDKIHSNSSIINLCGYNLLPLEDIVRRKQYVYKTKGNREWSYKVYTPYIKYFTK